MLSSRKILLINNKNMEEKIPKSIGGVDISSLTEDQSTDFENQILSIHDEMVTKIREAEKEFAAKKTDLLKKFGLKSD